MSLGIFLLKLLMILCQVMCVLSSIEERPVMFCDGKGLIWFLLHRHQSVSPGLGLDQDTAHYTVITLVFYFDCTVITLCNTHISSDDNFEIG